MPFARPPEGPRGGVLERPCGANALAIQGIYLQWPAMNFDDIHPSLRQAIAGQGYTELTPVQAAVMEAGAGADLLVSAQTGSGKTVAFGLAAAHTLLGEAERFARAETPMMLVIAPTRELALQVSRELEWLYRPAGAVIVTCVGGMDARREQRALAQGAHIVVGTPGRLHDHLDRGNLDLSHLRVAVLDEADEMLDMGFREDLEAILDFTPADRRTLLFSATLPKEIVGLAKRYQRDAQRIDTLRRGEQHGDIEYRVVTCAPHETEHAVVNLLRYFEAPGALIFCATREAVRHLHGALRERGFSAVALSGEMTQKERTDALHALREGHARACVATDVAARGLDLPDLNLVIHATLPQNKAALLHRSGRTGRAGRKGTSVLISPHNWRRRAEQLLASAGVEAEWSGPPLAEEIRAKDQQRLLADPVFVEAPAEEELVLARKLLEGRSPEAVATALARMYQARLPEPEDLIDTPYVPQSRDRPQRGDRPDRGERPDRGDRPPRPPRNVETGDGVWFRMRVGRTNNADPKWLVPLICRIGHVTKPEIGAIRIFDRETKFEIIKASEAKFREAIKEAAVAGDMRVEPAAAPPAGDRPRPHRKGADNSASSAPAKEPYVPRPRTGPNAGAPAFKGPKRPKGPMGPKGPKRR